MTTDSTRFSKRETWIDHEFKVCVYLTLKERESELVASEYRLWRRTEVIKVSRKKESSQNYLITTSIFQRLKEVL